MGRAVKWGWISSPLRLTNASPWVGLRTAAPTHG